jgi:2,3-bisphosphoglycerate-independent phosphoglycerate mutase
MLKKKPLVLIILDGWGYSENPHQNAIALAKTPQWDEWWATCPHALLDASGTLVGLPEHQMGNSEVGHMHIGAGRVINQDFTRINDAIIHGGFRDNEVFHAMIDTMKASHKILHIMGLLSSGGVHSHQQHLFAFLELCHQQKFNNIVLHLFFDGRDTAPQSALESLEALNQCLRQNPVGTIGSICGRYFAMDRDKRWERIAPVYDLLTQAQAKRHFSNAETAIQTYYNEKIYDEFFPPTLIGDGKKMEDGDSIFFFNFRSDRARQLTQAFIDTSFDAFVQHTKPQIAHFVSMTRYADNLATECAFLPMSMQNTFGEIIARQGLRQLRIAETEKYAHVTFFFNGGCEQVFQNEERVLIASPHVATYDLLPEMSAFALTDALVSAIESENYDVIICNYANADMVGHSGNLEATMLAIECLDQCLQKVGKALTKVDGKLVLTADHGNAESMFDETTHQANTAHTTEPVPFLYVGGAWQLRRTRGSLTDIAPTLLDLLGIDKPLEMTGTSLLME